MKELSIEQKAKAYDKVREKITLRFGSNVTEEIFSEFEMSDDEKIRKQILSFLKEFERDHYRNIDFSSWIAWLDKLGEKKPVKNIVETWKDMRLEVYQQASGNRHEPNYSDDTTKMFSLNDIDEIIEKMSEYKHWDYVKPISEEDKLYLMPDEQKPASNVESKDYKGENPIVWSEKDEKETAVLEAYIRSKDWSERHIDRALGIVDELVNKIKSLKSIAQSKQKWNEEDEKAINDIMWIIEAYRKNGFNETHIQMADNSEKWLKSLRPQSKWKPSKEQMEQLGKYCPDNTALTALYEYLKQL